MNIGVIGINHNLAPINIREHVSFTDIQKIEAINYFLDRDIGNCNFKLQLPIPFICYNRTETPLPRRYSFTSLISNSL